MKTDEGGSIPGSGGPVRQDPTSRGAELCGTALLALVSIALFFRYPGRRFLSGDESVPGDFGVYLRAWQRACQGMDPYIPSELSPFKYSPGTLWFLGLLPEHPARSWLVYGTLSILLWAIALFLGARPLRWRSVGLLALGIALSWKGVLETLDYGQTEFFLLFLAVLAGVLFRRWPFLSGLSLGMMPMFKLPWAFLLLPFLLRALPDSQRTHRLSRFFKNFFSGYFLAVFLWAVVIPSLAFGPDRAKALSQSWLRLLRTQPSDLYLNEINQSLLIGCVRAVRFLQGDSGNGQPSLLALALAFGLAGGILGVLTTRLLGRIKVRNVPTGAAEPPLFRWLSAWLIFNQLLNPLAWRWGSLFVVGAPFSAVASIHSDRGRSGLLRVLRIALFAGIAVFWLLQQNPVTRWFGFHHWTDLHGYGVITGYWLLLILC